EARLDWNQPAPVLARRVRAFSPWPVAAAELAGERLRIHAAHALDEAAGAAPGSIVAAGRDGIDVACGEGRLRLLKVQREGGRPVSAADYLNARQDLRTAGARRPARRCAPPPRGCWRRCWARGVR